MLLASSAYMRILQVVHTQIGTQPAVNGVGKQSWGSGHMSGHMYGYVSKKVSSTK